MVKVNGFFAQEANIVAVIRDLIETIQYKSNKAEIPREDVFKAFVEMTKFPREYFGLGAYSGITNGDFYENPPGMLTTNVDDIHIMNLDLRDELDYSAIKLPGAIAEKAKLHVYRNFAPLKTEMGTFPRYSPELGTDMVLRYHIYNNRNWEHVSYESFHDEDNQAVVTAAIGRKDLKILQDFNAMMRILENQAYVTIALDCDFSRFKGADFRVSKDVADAMENYVNQVIRNIIPALYNDTIECTYIAQELVRNSDELGRLEEQIHWLFEMPPQGIAQLANIAKRFRGDNEERVNLRQRMLASLYKRNPFMDIHPELRRFYKLVRERASLGEYILALYGSPTQQSRLTLDKRIALSKFIAKRALEMARIKFEGYEPPADILKLSKFGFEDVNPAEIEGRQLYEDDIHLRHIRELQS